MNSIYLKSIIVLSPWLLTRCNNAAKEESGDDRPNILIAMGDDISFPHMGAYGCQFVKTPGFDRVA
ncbi:MAG TPA: hypothetical protein VFC41_02435, partial [Anaerovoracaceae bacterium]|nr:hypothetical protein [Anaerovoracaceae bacterium]